MSTVFFTILICAIAGGCWVVYTFSSRAVARREGRRLSEALGTTSALFAALDKIPNVLIGRELRRGLVLIASHHVNVLTKLQPRHPHLHYLTSRLGRLNKIPTGFEKPNIRSKAERREVTLALEALADLIKTSARARVLPAKQADLAAAAATFAAQQIAVETARQAAKDAENVRAYKQALNFAYQAQGLCRKLPPLMAEALSESVSADVKRLETQLGRPARI